MLGCTCRLWAGTIRSLKHGVLIGGERSPSDSLPSYTGPAPLFLVPVLPSQLHFFLRCHVVQASSRDAGAQAGESGSPTGRGRGPAGRSVKSHASGCEAWGTPSRSSRGQKGHPTWSCGSPDVTSTWVWGASAELRGCPPVRSPDRGPGVAALQLCDLEERSKCS